MSADIAEHLSRGWVVLYATRKAFPQVDSVERESAKMEIIPDRPTINHQASLSKANRILKKKRLSCWPC